MENQSKPNSQLLNEIKHLKAENAELKKRKDFFQVIADNVVDNIAITTFDLKAKYIYVSPSIKKTLGFAPEELVGKSFFDFIHSDDKKVISLLIKRYIGLQVKSLLKEGDPEITENIEFRFKSKTGNYRYMQSKVSFIGKNLLAISRDITERKQMEEKLLQSEIKFRKIFKDHSAVELIINSESGKIYDANQAAAEFYGWSVDELKTMNIAQINTLSNQRLKKELEMAKSKKSNYFEFKHRRADGEVRDVEVYSGAVTILGENFLHSIIHDITDRKQVEKELQQSEEKYRSFFENNNAIILFINPENREIVFSNQAAANYYGYSIKQLTEMNLREINILPEEDLKMAVNNARKNKHNYFLSKHKLASGEIRDVEVYQTKLHTNNHELFSTIVHDITDRNKANQELIIAKEKIELSEKKFRELFEKSGDPFLIIENEKFVDCNDATVKLLKYNNKEEILNFHPAKLSPPFQSDGQESIEKANVLIQNALEKGTQRFEWDHIKSTGEIFPVEVLLTSISNQPNKKVIHTVWRDITNRKRAEKDIKSALKKAKESDRLKSAFLANMSHEIRTPMNGILGFANLLKEQELSGDEQENYIEIIEKSGERMLNIINDLIDIAKVESGQMEIALAETNINNQIEYAYTFFKPEVVKKGMKFSIKTPLSSEEAIVNTDKEKFFAILTNLVKNAIKYSEYGEIEIGYEKKNKYFEFYVKDSGIGIPKNMHKPIFDRFIQAKAAEKKAIQGSGLGLSISKAYVEMLGGKIWVESKLNEGSTFYFTLPIKTIGKNQREIKNKSALFNKEGIIKKLKILIVDDEEIATLLLKKILHNVQKEILYAESGTQAVDIFLKNPDIDLILMDIRMPEMDGYQATKKIRLHSQDVKIIAQTAFAITGDQEKAIESGCNAYVSKPISKSTLLTIIEKQFS